MKNVLYLGWLGFRNLGDELLWNLFKDFGQEYLKDFKITPSIPGVSMEHVEPYDAVVLGGGSLILPGYVKILNKAMKMGKTVLVWGSGVDWIGKKELDLLRSDTPTTLTMNFKEQDSAMMQETFDAAAFTGIRGPLSKKVLETIGADNPNVRVIGDPGLLLHPEEDKLVANKEKIVGINWGTTYNRLYGGNEEAVEDTLVNVAKKLIQLGYKIYIYVVWDNDRKASKRLYDKINDAKNVTFDKALCKEQELMALLSRFALTINFKLHANLLSLAAGVPALALGYRFKVFDFVASLGLENYIVSTDSTKLEKEILAKVDLIERNRNRIIHKYRAAQKSAEPLLLEPFKNNLFL